MKILVTGANGYLGQGIVHQILDDGHTVIAADFKTDHVDDRANTSRNRTSCSIWRGGTASCTTPRPIWKTFRSTSPS